MSAPQGLLVRCPINNILPVETLEMIFEERVKVEWRAPAIDGRVCRLWRQVVLFSPRAWSYLEIYHNRPPSIKNYARSYVDPGRHLLTFVLNKTLRSPSTLTNGHCTTYSVLITQASHLCGCLSMNCRSLKRDFPSMRTLDVKRWFLTDSCSYPVQCGILLGFRSLRMGVVPVPY